MASPMPTLNPIAPPDSPIPTEKPIATPTNALPTPLTPSNYPLGGNADRVALVQMQRVLWARVQDKSVPPHIAAQCARAWRDLQDMKRIIDGKATSGFKPDVAPKPKRARLLPLPDAVPIVNEGSEG